MQSKLIVEITQSPWLDAILADPISKSPLKKDSDCYYSSNGFGYSINEGIPNFGIRLNQFEDEWQKGQDVYENAMSRYLARGEQDGNMYEAEQQRDEPMYTKLPLEGRVLDVGGNLGAIRKYMKENQEFCSIDPFINVYKLAAGKTNLFKYYPMHLPLNFVVGFAEFLPFIPASFDTVNMRSCLDHFFNPELSLLEANRVLKDNGKLIIGMTVKVASAKNLKETVRSVLNVFTSRFKDAHMFHPSKDEIINMCKRCGFELEDEIWQSEQVWYAAFRKSKTLIKIT